MYSGNVGKPGGSIFDEECIYRLEIKRWWRFWVVLLEIVRESGKPRASRRLPVVRPCRLKLWRAYRHGGSCFGAWDCKSSGRRDKSLGSVKRVDNVGWKASNSLIERSVRIFRRGASRRLVKGLDLRYCRSCWMASTKEFLRARISAPTKIVSPAGNTAH
jgi:hypothetical protein